MDQLWAYPTEFIHRLSTSSIFSIRQGLRGFLICLMLPVLMLGADAYTCVDADVYVAAATARPEYALVIYTKRADNGGRIENTST